MSFTLDVRVEREHTIGGKVSSERDAVSERLRAIRDALTKDQLRFLLRQVGDVYYRSTLERFRSQSEPSGQKWAAWAELTRMLRRTGVGNRPPAISSVSVGGVTAGGKLIWTGKLMRSIKSLVRTDRATVYVGVNSAQVPYAWIHQMGYGGGSFRTIPRRKFLGYTKRANAEAMQVISNYLMAQAFGISME